MNEVTLRQLEYVVAVDDERHFGRAADRCAVSQPGLSGQIKRLEEQLGVRLFERNARGVLTTAAGAEVVGRARRLLRDVADLARSAEVHRGTIHGTLRIGAIPTIAPYLLPATVRQARSLWPDGQLTLHEHQTIPLIAAVETGRIDLGLLAIPYDTGALTVRALADDEFVLAVPEGDEIATSAEPIPVSVLSELPILLLEEGHCLREHARSACQLAGNVDVQDISAASLATLTQMVAAGAGATLLPRTALAVEARGGTGVAVRPFVDPAPSRTVALVWRSSDPRSPLFEELSDGLRQMLRDGAASG